MKTIPLTQGKVAIVDDDMFEYLNQWKWHLSGTKYAVRTVNNKKIYMHRLVAKVPEGMCTDHINRNKLDNQKSNLRVCTITENNRNRDKQHNNLSGLKGVSWINRPKPWSSRICVNKKIIYLGWFDTKEEAYEAYLKAENKHFGEFARLNQVEAR